MRRTDSRKPYFDHETAIKILNSGHDANDDAVVDFVVQARHVNDYACRLECDLNDAKHRITQLEAEAEMMKRALDADTEIFEAIGDAVAVPK